MNNPVPISFEFFPPNTPVGAEKLKTVVQDLSAVRPEFFSVTYGAGGATRDKTLATVQDIAAAGHDAAPHLSCVGSTAASISEILDTYRTQGIKRLVALRGDLPSGTATAGEFRYASDLIEFIRKTQGSDWHIEVAAYPEYHPQQRYARKDLEHFAAKVQAGASSAITQFFFNPDAYFHFVDEVRALGVTVPIVAGIMPIHNYAKIAQFAARDGIEIPRWVALKIEGYLEELIDRKPGLLPCDILVTEFAVADPVTAEKMPKNERMRRRRPTDIVQIGRQLLQAEPPFC